MNRVSRKDTIDRHLTAFKDLAANPGKYAQDEWVRAHCIGNRSATSAIRLGIILRNNGKLYCTENPVNTDTVRRVLNNNANDRRIENEMRGLPKSANAFYAHLPERFTTAEATKVADSLGIPKTTMQRILRMDGRIAKDRHGKYGKVHNYTHTVPFKVANMTEPERKALKEISEVELTFSARQPERVGLVRRFIRWIW
jgi:hypothetical protein